MPDDLRSVSLVVPVFNEEERLAEHLTELLSFVASQPAGSELVFVDDGSTDRTVEELEGHLQHQTLVATRVLRRPHQGKGAAVAAGIRASDADLIAFCDVDLSTPLHDVQMIVRVAAVAEVLAIGSRDLSGSVLARPQGKVRETLGRAYNRLMQATVTPGIVDTQCGAKAAHASVWRRLLPYCQQVGFAWDAEVIAVALAAGVEVQEVAITWHHDDRSQVHVLRDGIAMVRETPRIVRTASLARAANRPDVPSMAGLRPDMADEVFDPVNAERMQAVDRTHWWFRSKAAFVATALRRTAGPAREAGWLLDAGGGSGGVSAMLGWPIDRVAVVEGNSILISTAKRHLGLAAVQGSVHGLPADSASIDVVCLLDVIEHLADPRSALVEAARVLRPDGRLIVNVPAHRWLWSAADVQLGHHRRYTRASLRAELRSAGFEPVVLTHVFSWLVPAVWFVRRVSRPSRAELGLDRRSLPIDVISLALTAAERLLIGRVSIPLGTSVLCVARPATGDRAHAIQ